MTEYQPQEMDCIGMGTEFGESYALYKISNIWSIEHYRPDDSTFRYFDEETAKEEWAKLKEARKERIVQARKARDS